LKVFAIVVLLVAVLAGVYLLTHRDEVSAWHAQAQYKHAEAAFSEGTDLQKAAEGYESFAAALPDDERAPGALANAAECYGRLNSPAERDRVWALLLGRYPASSEAVAVKARRVEGLAAGGRLDEAVTLGGELLQLSPELVGSTAPLALGRALAERGDLKGAKPYLLYALSAAAGDAEAAKPIKELLGNVNLSLIFSPAPTEGSITYTVAGGDTLVGIALANGTTVAQIKRSNGLKDNILHPGQRLKVLTPTYEIHISLGNHTLTLSMNGEFLKEYPVGVGKFESTPMGEYTIVDKVENPTWYSKDGVFPFGDPRNVLGTRWMSLNMPSYGIHGTSDDASIGQSSSAGCVRMHNSDVEELYDLVTKGTKVYIEP